MFGGSLKHLDQRVIALDHSKEMSSATDTGTMGPIWQYWEQGADSAPPIVQMCLQSVQRNNGGREVIVLDDHTIRQYIELPEHIWRKRHLMSRAHFSNFVRLGLLKRHGGTWLDATILLTKPMPKRLENRSFLMLRQSGNPRLTETWFIHARQGHPFIETIFHALSDYWKHYDGLHGYFMFAYHIEALLILHARLRRRFLRMPQIAVHSAHALQKQFDNPFDEVAHRAILERSWLHKLSYKFVRPETDERLLWDAMVDGWPECVVSAPGSKGASTPRASAAQ